MLIWIIPNKGRYLPAYVLISENKALKENIIFSIFYCICYYWHFLDDCFARSMKIGSSNSKQFYVYYLLRALVYLLNTLISDKDFNSLSDYILLCQNVKFVSRKLTEESLSWFDVLWSINSSGRSHLTLSFNHDKDQRLVYLTVIIRFFSTSVLRGEINLHE